MDSQRIEYRIIVPDAGPETNRDDRINISKTLQFENN